MSKNANHMAAKAKAVADRNELLARFRGLLQGAEDEEENDDGAGANGGDGAGDGAGDGENSSDDGSGQESDSDDDGDDDGAGQETFSADYVKKLRQEAAANRKKAKEFEAKLQKHERSKLDAKERAELEAQEAKKKAEDATNALVQERVRNALLAEASDKNFHDVKDVYALIDRDSIEVDDDGMPDAASVKKAVDALVKAKPHLVAKKSKGSGDGASHGSGGVNEDEAKAKAIKEFQGRGMVPIS